MVQELTLREKFLKQNWQRYPAMTENCWIRGRIVSMGSDKIELDNGSAFNPMKATLIEKNYAVSSVLVKGDVVAVSQLKDSYQVTLLAPCLDKQLLSIDPQIVQKWNVFLAQVRQFFLDKKFLEIQTPSLVRCPGTEVYVDAFEINNRYLPTSPEIHLKKVISMGFEKIFEIKNCFRKEEVTEHHQPEFYMLEWYRAYANLDSIKQDLKDLVNYLCKDTLVQTKTMAELFLEQGMLLTPETTAKDFLNWAKEKNLHTHPSDTIDDLFFRIFVEIIEPKLPSQPLIVEAYPPFQAAYARLRPDGWADRFEFYWQGLEIANAFHEVNDPDLQESRMRSDLDKKKQLGKSAVGLDPEFFQALRAAIPPSGGIALGLERLFMAINAIEKIQDMKLFPVRNLTGE